MSTSTRTAATTTTTRTGTATTRRLRRLAATTGLVAVIALAAAACSDDSGSPKAASANPAGAPISTLAPKTGTQTGVTTQPAQPTSQPGQPAGNPTPQPQPTPQPSAPAPVIDNFTTPDNIDCHNGNFQNFSASWQTRNAVKTTIAIDGSGIYKTYGPNDNDSLPFNCSSSHTFLLTAYGADGHSVSQTITLQPRNVQAQGNGDPDQ